MELSFEVNSIIGEGKSPDFIQFMKSEGELFHIQNGKLFGKTSTQFNGDFSNPNWGEILDITPPSDFGVSDLTLNTLPGFGIIGSYKTEDSHKMLIYEFSHDISDYLNSGTLRFNIDNPTGSFTLSLENPDLKDPERPGTLLNADKGFLDPGGKLYFEFQIGSNSQKYILGTMYIDRSDLVIGSETVTIDGRGTIGKILGDQTVDDGNEFWYAEISENIKTLLERAQITSDHFLVADTTEKAWYNFDPNTTSISALDTMLETLPNWKVGELSDGTVVVGPPEYEGFDRPGLYTFYRNRDIFSRQITRDDAQAFRKVCIHTEGFSDSVYSEVSGYTGWNLQANKTYFVQVSNGMRRSMMEAYATELASRLRDSGKLESFTGPFRPQLQCGDEAIIIEPNGSESLGVVTELTHRFGKNGFFTDFTVDSGGSVGKGRISDFIKKITNSNLSGSGDSGWGDIDYTEYVNLAIGAQVVVSSTKNIALPASLLNNNKMYAPDDLGWSPADSDPFIEMIFSKKTTMSQIDLYLGYDDPDTDPINLPDGYTIEYYNYDTKTWTHLITVNSNITFKMSHEFSPTNTSRIRIKLLQKDSQRWREIQVFGFL